MMKTKIKKVDCLWFYVDDLEKWIEFYGKKMWLKLKWKWEDDAWFELWNSEAELVIQTKEKRQEVDLMVEDVLQSTEEFRKIGAKILVEPFDINIWKCAVIEDLWGNSFTILDSSKWLYKTDEKGNIVEIS